MEVKDSKNTKKPKKTTKKKPKRKYPFGRPTKYKSTYPKQMFDYFMDCFNAEPKKVVKKKFAWNVTWEDYQVLLPDVPTFTWFALSIWVTDETLQQWKNKVNEDWSLVYPDFSVSYHACKKIQEKFLFKHGLSWLAKDSMAKFGLVNNHGWIDTKHHNLGWQKDNPIKTDQNVKFDKSYEEMTEEERQNNLLQLLTG